MPADYFGDGRADFAVFRPSTGYWYQYQPITGRQGSYGSFGGPGVIPTPCDFDGDGRADCAFYVPSNGAFYAYCSPSIQPVQRARYAGRPSHDLHAVSGGAVTSNRLCG